MTTNITAIEALEKIAKTGCTRVNNMFQCNTCGEGNKSVCPRYIAIQALAPQEPQQKTFTVEEIKRILKNIHKKEFYDCGECTECLLAELEKAVG